MEWKEHAQSSVRIGIVTGYVATLAADNWESVANQLPDLWKKLCDAMINHHGSHSPEEWDAFLCMVRPTSGTIHIAPIRIPWKTHVNRTWVMVKIPLMEEEYYNLPHEDSAAFDPAHDAIMQRIFDMIRESAITTSAQSCLQDLYSRHPFTIYGIQYDDVETMVDLGVSLEAEH